MPEIIMFDMDGTLTPDSSSIQPDMIESLKKLKNKGYRIGIVTGATHEKILKNVPEEHRELFDYLFSENGMHSLNTKTGEIKLLKIMDFLGKEDHDRLVSWMDDYLLNYPFPYKADMNVSIRDCSLSVSPLGKKNYKQYEDEFVAVNVDNCILKENIERIKAEFPDLAQKLDFAVGNATSFDIVPKGNSKSFCLQFLTDYKEVHFFGDKVFPGGNDYEIFHDERVKSSYHVTDY